MTKPRIKENIDLGKFTTFKIGGPARYFLEVRSQQEIIDGVKRAEEKGLPFFILAGGSNLLVADRGFDGLAIKVQSDGKAVISSSPRPLRAEGLSQQTEDLKQRDSSLLLRMTQNEDRSMILKAEAGVRLSDIVRLSLEYGLGGLEWAAGIPRATVGGAIWGNAGAFGKNMADVVSEVEAIKVKSSPKESKLPTGQAKLNLPAMFRIAMQAGVQSYKNKDCNFGYKSSIFKEDKGLVILSADLVLEKKNQEGVREEIKKVLKYRKDHHPIEPSAGSVFKNIKAGDEVEKLFKNFPEAKIFEDRGEVPAGWLIEQCGLKGKKINGAQISPKHANFIVNAGSAQAEDVVGLIKLARQKVREKFGIILEEEIQYVGF